MPELTKIRVWKLNRRGILEELADFEKEARSLDQVSSALPQGVYTSFRTYQHFLGLHLADHFHRLKDGADRFGCPIKLNPTAIRRTLRSILAGLEGTDFRFRLSVDLEIHPGEVYILAEKLVIPPVESYHMGVKTLARPFERVNAETKYTRFILNSTDYRKLISKEINEVLLFNRQGQILEGLSSNFYGVIGSSIFTANEGILLGITRNIVLNEAQKEGLKVIMEPVSLEGILALDEVFITSASRAVLPVKQVENHIIGRGHTGEITRLLGDLYNQKIQSELEEI